MFAAKVPENHQCSMPDSAAGPSQGDGNVPGMPDVSPHASHHREEHVDSPPHAQTPIDQGVRSPCAEGNTKHMHELP